MERAPEPGDIILWKSEDTESWVLFQATTHGTERTRFDGESSYDTEAVGLAEQQVNEYVPDTHNRWPHACTFGPQSTIVGHGPIIEGAQPNEVEDNLDPNVEHDL